MNKNKVIGILGFSLLAIVCMAGIIVSITEILDGTWDIVEEEVKCYDRHSNEIVGMTCINKTSTGDSSIFLLLVFIIGLVFSLGSLAEVAYG